MIISDLQYIETVDNSDVQGGWKSKYYPKYYSSVAGATASAEAFGDKTEAFANTFTFTAPGVSAAGSNSFSSSSGYSY
ncbi:MAG: hypothetical protein AAGF83_13830 [Cyanobacteria bacterium P01_G01_bin.67]